MTPPDNPHGEYKPNPNPTPAERAAAIEAIGSLPRELLAALDGLSEEEINGTLYRNWTLRQIVHHLGDSHANGLLRMKLALTGDTPRIFAYDPGAFVALADSSELPVEIALLQLDAIHARWSHLLKSLTDEQFTKCYFHPEQNRPVSVNEALGIYSWHGRHHTAQILWARKNRLMEV
jgi:DinB superfamily